MTPRITFSVVKNTLKIRIKIHTVEPATFDTGIFCPREKFDAKKQICGYPAVQTFMDSTSEAIRKAFLPGMTPESLWNKILEQRQEAMQTHTVKDSFEYYLKFSKVRKATKANKLTLIEHLKAHGFYEKTIKDMNGAAFREFLGCLEMSESSLHATYVRLRTVLSRYIKDHSLSIQLPSAIVPKAKPTVPAQDEFLTWDELQVLLKAEAPERKEKAHNRKVLLSMDMFRLMCLTGMAVGDVVKFDPAKHVDGKWIKYYRKKNGRPCTIPLLPQTQEIIDRHKWPAIISTRAIQLCCENIISGIVGRKMKSHSGRKTFGAIMLELGYSMESVAAMLGHSTPQITAKIYAKVSKAKIEREMKELPPAIKQMMGI